MKMRIDSIHKSDSGPTPVKLMLCDRCGKIQNVLSIQNIPVHYCCGARMRQPNGEEMALIRLELQRQGIQVVSK
jgi:hypothetical protein